IALLDEAARGQIHIALGTYPSWTAWFSENVTIRPIYVTDRQELAKMMTSRGMSTRAAAKALDCSQSTLSRDVRGESFDSTSVTTLDGKTAPRNKPAKGEAAFVVADEALEAEEVPLPDEDEDEQPIRPISADFQEEMWNLKNTRTALKELLEDERILVV